jgi:hypothetical protein
MTRVTPLKLSRNGRAALALSEGLGWATFPCDPATKQPLTSRGFYDAATHPEAIGAFWDRWPDASIGFWPGPAGIVVIDADSPEAERAARALGVHDDTLRVRTARGWHWYKRLPKGVEVGNVTGLGFDVRSMKGYVIVPPSLHPTGVRYTFHGDFDAIAPAPDALLYALTTVTQISPAPLTARNGAADTADVLDFRIRRWIERIGHRPEGARDTGAFAIAAFIVNDLALSADVAAAYLLDWNRGNQPPLPERQLLAKITSASRSAKRPAGCAR